MVNHIHTFVVDNQTISITFDDKRTLNSVIKALEKAKSIRFESSSSNTIETPRLFDDWKIVKKSDHIALKPPENHTKEIVSLIPDFAIQWNPNITGKYWNDGMYHFFPTKTKLSAEFTNDDIINNLKSMGAEFV